MTPRPVPSKHSVHILGSAGQLVQLPSVQGAHAPEVKPYPRLHDVQLVKFYEQRLQLESEQTLQYVDETPYSALHAKHSLDKY